MKHTPVELFLKACVQVNQDAGGPALSDSGLMQMADEPNLKRLSEVFAGLVLEENAGTDQTDKRSESAGNKYEDLARDAEALLFRAIDLGMNITITRAPLTPLAMGHMRDVIEVWPMRQLAEPIRRAPTVQHLPADDTEGGQHD